MKTIKKNTIHLLAGLLFSIILLPACGQTDSKGAASATKPDMDIQSAIIAGDLPVVRQHIEAGTDINKPEPLGGATPLITAATFGEPQIAKALIDAGADLTLKNNDGATALHAAAFFCRIEVVQVLIDANADKSALNNFGATAAQSVSGPFTDIKPVYEMMKMQLEPLGLELDIEEVEKSRPVVAMMLQ